MITIQRGTDNYIRGELITNNPHIFNYFIMNIEKKIDKLLLMVVKILEVINL